MKKSVWWVIAIVVIILVIVGVSSNSKKPAETGPIKIGMISPLSGNVAALGELMKNVTGIAIDEVNASGGVNGRPISVIYEDDQCNPAKSVSAAQKLIEVDKVRIIIGSSCSGAVLSMLPVTDKAGVFLMSGSATSPALDGKSDLFARTIANDSSEGSTLAQVAISHGWRKVAFLQESSDYALGLYNAFLKNYPASIGTILHEEYPDSMTDFRSVLAKMRSSSPDVLFLDPQSPATAQRILTNFAQMNWRVPLLVNHVISGGADLVAQNSKILEGAYAAEQSPDLTNDKYKALEAKYKSLHGKEMDYKAYGEAEYDLVYIIREGLLKFGNDPKKISDWVRTIKDFDGASGKLSMSSDGNRIGGHTLKIITNGVAVPVATTTSK